LRVNSKYLGNKKGTVLPVPLLPAIMLAFSLVSDFLQRICVLHLPYSRLRLFHLPFLSPPNQQKTT
jgi:hypothetical protein